MQSLRKNKDVVVYIKSLLNEGMSLPYYSVAKLLKVYGYVISDIRFIEPSNRQDRLTISSIQERDDGVALVIFEKSWANYLPIVYRNETLENFLYGFQLSMFKQVEIVDKMEELFIPEKTPDDFVAWLASWFNISFSNEIKLENRRKVIYRLTELYGMKGTKKYLVEMVKLLTDIVIDIEERASFDNEYGDVNKNLSFLVTIVKEPMYHNAEEEKRLHAIVKNIIEKEKPIFTYAQFDNSFIFDKFSPISVEEVVKEKEKTIYIDDIEPSIEEKEDNKLKEDKNLDDDDEDYYY